jgi:hypothetical protein
MTLDEYFSTGPERERPIFEAVSGHLESLGPVHVEAVSVGIFFKKKRTFVELRPMQKWVALSFGLTRTVHDRRISRRASGSGPWVFHFVRVRDPEDVDDQVRDWLTESYLVMDD